MRLTRIPYKTLVHESLRQVVRDALGIAARQGLPGDHHFYVTFRTDHPRVRLPDYLRKRYDRQMTIVLQHQFSGLEVDGDGFKVQLSFDGVMERLAVPFEAIQVFADPAADFMLNFEEPNASGAENPDLPDLALDPPEPSSAAQPKSDEKIVSLDKFRRK